MNKLPYVDKMYSGNHIVVDNTVGTWQPLTLGTGVTGDARYMILTDRIIFTGKIILSNDIQYSQGAIIFELPGNIEISGGVKGSNYAYHYGYYSFDLNSSGTDIDKNTTSFNIVNNTLTSEQFDVSSFYLDTLELTYTKS